MEIRVNDYGYDLTFTVKNGDGSVVNLATAGVVGVKLQVATSLENRNIIDGDCSIPDADNGIVKYSVGADDFTKAGNYIGGLKLDYGGGGKYVTTKDIHITVKPSLK